MGSRIGAGVLGGLLGTVVMLIVFSAAFYLGAIALNYPASLGGWIIPHAGTMARFWVGVGLAVAIGVVLGLLFGVIFPARAATSVGILYGAVWWLIAGLVLSAFGVMSAFWRLGPAVVAISLVGYMIYGGLTGYLVELTARRRVGAAT
ncbi:MAG: hypothetical protein QME70_00265 [Bacillota bacterium]|nr:hypothetical protein [Bacillota bacterium]